FGSVVGHNLAQDGLPGLGSVADAVIDAGGEAMGGTISTVGNIGRDASERLGELNLNNLGSTIRQGADTVRDLADNGSELLDGLADSGRDYAGGDRVEGALGAVGDVADFAIDSVGDVADGVVGLAGDTA